MIAVGRKGTLRERSSVVRGVKELTDGFHASRLYGDVKVILTEDCGKVFRFNI